MESTPKKNHSPDKEQLEPDNNSTGVTHHQREVKIPEFFPDPSHISTGEYAALMETNEKECESWYYFIRREGNDENLKYLQKQLEKVDWYIMDDLSTFDLDLEHYVSANTAKEMTKIELNSYAFHRKFDGKLDKITLGFKKKDNDETMMCKAFDQLGYGQIEDFISDEDIDEEDLTDRESTDEESDDSSEEENSTESEEEKKKEVKHKKRIKGIPPALLTSELPGWAKARRRKGRK